MQTRRKSLCNDLSISKLDEDCLLEILGFCTTRELLFMRVSKRFKKYVLQTFKTRAVCHDTLHSDELLCWVLEHSPSLKFPPRSNIIAKNMEEYTRHTLYRKFQIMDLSMVASRLCKDEKMLWNYWWMSDIVINTNLWKQEKFQRICWR